MGPQVGWHGPAGASQSEPHGCCRGGAVQRPHRPGCHCQFPASARRAAPPQLSLVLRPTLPSASPAAPACLAAPLELSLVLCDDGHIQELNKEWRGVDAPTDVLSFELEDDEEVEGGAAPEVWPAWLHPAASCSALLQLQAVCTAGCGLWV